MKLKLNKRYETISCQQLMFYGNLIKGQKYTNSEQSFFVDYKINLNKIELQNR